MKGLFEPELAFTFANKESVLELKGCGIDLIFRKSEHEDFRHVSERYIVKPDPFIVMVSTPFTPDGLFDIIKKESVILLLSWNISLILRQAIGKELKWC
jgi:hypothetical protein